MPKKIHRDTLLDNLRTGKSTRDEIGRDESKKFPPESSKRGLSTGLKPKKYKKRVIAPLTKPLPGDVLTPKEFKRRRRKPKDG